MATVAEEIAALRGTKPATLKDLLTEPSFSRLWRAMLVSSLGDWVGFVGVAALVARLGGNSRLGPLAVAGVMLARLLPSVVFGPFAGVFADRFNRKRLMIGADLARGTLYASMPFMPGLWAIFLLSFCIECLSLLWTPSKDASIPNLVPRRQLDNANSVSLITTYGTLPMGAFVYTMLAVVATGIGAHPTFVYFRRHPEFLALWLDALTFFFSARMIWGLNLRQTTVARTRALSRPKFGLRSAVDDLKEGLAFLRGHPTIRIMTVGIVMAFAGAGSVIALGPVFARYSLLAGSTGFGVLMIALGLGMGAGMGLMGFLTKFVDREKLFYLAMLGAAACEIVLAAMPTIALAALFTVPTGFGAGLTWVTGYTLLQENSPDEYRGRTFATLNVWGRMALFVSLAGFPGLAAAVGPTHFVTIGGRVLDFGGTRIALWLGGAVVVFGGMFSRKGLGRARLARPRPLALTPRLHTAEHDGMFVVFEGVEGAGKGTQIELARQYLESSGREVVVTREPGGTEFGDRLRKAILDPATGHVEPRAEALAFAASRAQHVVHVIRPALAEGKVVLCDRFIDSSVAYQGVARGLGEQDVLTLNAWATQGLFPDLVLLLDVDPGAGLARAGDAPDRIESEDAAFHAKVADAYLKIAEEHPERFVVIDALGKPEDVHARVRSALDKALSVGEGGRAGPT